MNVTLNATKMAFTSDVLTTTKTTRFKFLIAIVLLCVLSIFGNFQNGQKRGKVPHYSVVSKYMSIGTLIIDVFTDEETIEEKKLRLLMSHFFKRYSNPKNLNIYLYTHESQLRDLGKIAVITPNEEAERHPYATIVRLDGKQEINIKLPDKHWHTITVKEPDETNKQ